MEESMVHAAADNTGDYTQPSPLIGYYEGNPGFGPSFDTMYTYGPITGPHVGFGLHVFLP